MPIYSSDSDNETMPQTKLFGRQRSIRSVLGGGQVADVLLWENKKVSAALSVGMTVLWLLFEVAEYNFVTLFCHISIAAMLIIFIWFTTADFFNWNPPQIPGSILDKSTFNELAFTFHERSNQALSKFIDIARGKEPALFFMAIFFLLMLSVIGNYFTFLNFLYICFVCLQTLPFLHNKFEDEVEMYAGKLIRQVKKMFRRFDSSVLNKIPRGPVKEKKLR
ncbi:RETICULON-LIKE PROTEIN B9 [Salix purpurea]|uniref:Reticulon-like protein n=1 Tax=Salix purpurea TaxID=77065 RepID=A0A9Q0W349_SALPP|nr:RETICULON-LIKE PROTEIN B9 [Salix purpurea]